MATLITPRGGAAADSERELAWVIVVLSGIAAASHIWKLPSALERIREDIGLSLVEGGILVSLIQVASMLGGLLIAWSGDALGLRRLIMLGLVFLACGSVAGALSESAALLMGARLLEGIGFLLCTVLAPSLIRRCCRPNQLNRAMAGWGTFQGSAAVVGLGATALALETMDWRMWWLIMAAMALLPLPLLFYLVDPDPRTAPGRRSLFATAGPGIAKTARSLAPWLAGGVFGSYTLQWMALMSFLPTLLGSAGVSLRTAGLVAAAVGGVNVLGALIAGTALERGLRARTLVIGALASMSLCAVIAFEVTSAGTQGLLPLVIAACAVFSLVGGVVPAVMTRLTVDVTPAQGSMTASMGLMQQIFNLGNFVGPPLLAWMVTLAGGWHATWWLCLAASAWGTGMMVLLDRRYLRTY